MAKRSRSLLYDFENASLSAETLYKAAMFLTFFRAYILSESYTRLLFGARQHQLLVIIGVAAYLLLLAKAGIELSDWYNDPDAVLTGVIGVLSVIASQKSGTDWILDAWILIVCSYGIKEKELVKWLFICMASTILPCCILAEAGIIKNPVNNTTFGAAHTLGFYNVNSAASLLVGMVLLGNYLIRNRMNIFVCFIDYALAGLIFIKTYSRTNVFVLIGCASCILLLCLIRQREAFSTSVSKFVGNAAVLAVAVLIIVSVVVILSPDSFDDEVLTGRIKRTTWYFQKYSVTLFGQSIDTTEGGAFDMGFPHLLLRFGVVYFAIIAGLYARLLVSLSKRRDIFAVVIVLFFLLTGFTETAFIRWRYNFTFYLFGPMLWQSSTKEKFTGGKRHKSPV